MAPRNGQDFIEGLRRNPREVWVAGRRVDDITSDAVFRRPVQSIAQLYDLQTQPEHREVMTYVDDGGPAGSSFLIPRTHADLVKRRAAMKIWADATFGMVGRSPDYLNTVLMTWAEGADFFGRRGERFATAISFSPTPSSIRRATARRPRTSRRTRSSTSASSRRPRMA
jgi:aromatic ring hydroxylase